MRDVREREDLRQAVAKDTITIKNGDLVVESITTWTRVMRACLSW
jgi:hypothetical protein